RASGWQAASKATGSPRCRTPMVRSIPSPNPSQKRPAPGSTTMATIGGCLPHRSAHSRARSAYWRHRRRASRCARLSRAGSVWAGALCAAGFATAIAWIAAERIGIERLHDAGTHKLDLYAASLESALAKYEYLPGVVALRTDVVALLRSPMDLDLQHTVNLYLAEVNAQAQSSVLYVLDTSGRTLAASNW